MFEISGQNIPCGTSGVTCTKQVEVHLFEPEHVHLSLMKGRDLLLDDKPQSTPFKRDDLGLQVIQSGTWLMVQTKNHLRIMWDGATRVQLTVKPTLKNHLHGLCGSYNGRSADDLKTPAGDVEQDPYVFASKWKVDPTCQDFGDGKPPNATGACERNKNRRSWAERSCRIISHSPLFERCRQSLGSHNLDKYTRWCQEDSCSCDSGGDCECMCTSIASFAQECNKVGVAVRWRSNELCRKCLKWNLCLKIPLVIFSIQLCNAKMV